MIAVGEHLLGSVHDREIMMSTWFAGGIGSTYEDNCGVFSAGVMLIGSMYGRTTAEQDDEDCQALVAEYRTRFKARFETLTCSELREEDYGSGRKEPCSTLVERASQILLDVIHQSESSP